MESVPITVKSYSGHTYAERPVSFVWESREYQVKEIRRAWQEPGKRCFYVITEENEGYELCYDEGEDQWLLIKSR